MNRKLSRVLDEIQKTEERIAEWQEHLQQLNLRKKQLEEAEIIKSIRSMKLDSREMLVLLDGIQNGSVVFQSEADAELCKNSEQRAVNDVEMTRMPGQPTSESEDLENEKKD